MRKIYSLFIALLAVCGLAQAQVSFDFTGDKAYEQFGFTGFSSNESHDGDITENATLTSGDVTITITPVEKGNANRIWTGSLRLYGGSMTIASSGKNITAIDFTLNSGKWGANTADVGTLDTGKWTGDAASVVISIGGNTQIKSMTITLAGGDTPGPGPQPGETKTIAEILSDGAAEGTSTSGTVYAACPNGLIIGDGSGYIYVYRPTETAAVGDVVKVTGNVSEYGGCLQFAQGATLEKTGTATVTYPTAKTIDGAGLDALIAAPAVTYVKVTGTLTKSGNYNNLTVEGATNVGSLQVSNEVLGSAGTGDEIEVTGFFAYKSGSSTVYGNIVATEVKVLGDTPDPEAKVYTTIAAVKEAVTADHVDVVFKANNLLVTYVNGKNVYVFDGTDGLLLFANDASINEGIKAGDKITADFKGQLYLYNGLTEIATSAVENLTVNSSGNAVEPQKVTVADVSNNPKNYENELVKIEGLYPQAEALASRNITFMDDSDNQVIVRDNWNVLTGTAFDTESEYTVTGFVAIYNGNAQLYPRTADDVSNGETPQPYELQGDGTFENPYTVADVQYLYSSNEAPTEAVWVKGTIIGAAKSTMSNIVKEQGEDLQAANIVLADDADETSSAKMIPVQLPTGKVRDALNLVDNFGNLGKNVCVYGTIEKYFTVAGVKGVSDYSLDGIVTAIDKVETTTAQGAIYTIAGQRINHINHAGIYVVGGKKVVVK